MIDCHVTPILASKSVAYSVTMIGIAAIPPGI